MEDQEGLVSVPGRHTTSPYNGRSHPNLCGCSWLRSWRLPVDSQYEVEVWQDGLGDGVYVQWCKCLIFSLFIKQVSGRDVAKMVTLELLVSERKGFFKRSVSVMDWQTDRLTSGFIWTKVSLCLSKAGNVSDWNVTGILLVFQSECHHHCLSEDLFLMWFCTEWCGECIYEHM